MLMMQIYTFTSHYIAPLVIQQINQQDTQITYGQKHADQKHNVSECAVGPVVNAAHLFLP